MLLYCNIRHGIQHLLNCARNALCTSVHSFMNIVTGMQTKECLFWAWACDLGATQLWRDDATNEMKWPPPGHLVTEIRDRVFLRLLSASWRRVFITPALHHCGVPRGGMYMSDARCSVSGYGDRICYLL